MEIPGYRKRTTTVDNRGQMTELRDYYDSSSYLATGLFYDSYGNCDSIVYPGGSYFAYEYDAAIHTFQVRVTDAFGHYSQSLDYDYRFGIPLRVKDKSGHYMYYTLDQFGRTTEICAPKEQEVFHAIALVDTASVLLAIGDTNLATKLPISMGDFALLGGIQLSSHEIIPVRKEYTVKYVYRRGNVADNIPYSAITYNYDPANAGGNITTYTYSDGLGRIIQTKKDAEVNGEKVLVVSGKTYYDAFGRTVKTKYPTIENRTLAVVSVGNAMATPIVIGDLVNIAVIRPYGNLVLSTVQDTVPPSITMYDILDRPLVQRAPDNTEVRYQYGFGVDAGNGTVIRNCTLFRTSVTDQRNHTSITLANVAAIQGTSRRT